GLLTRALVVAAMPFVLVATGFAHRQEIAQGRALLRRAARRGMAGEPA
ncbi:MAG: hypothetical protein JO286_04300, partial [Solirubrobacterales bacterium]|nr:hypothetical protein [Solirubrobacterales bacterium]